MKIYIIDTQEIMPIGDFIQRMRENLVSFPLEGITADTLAGHGAVPLNERAEPIGEPWQSVVEDGVEEENGIWYIRKVLSPTFEQQEDEDAFVAEWLDRLKEQKLRYLAQRRWEAEVSGFTANFGAGDVFIKTDETTQRKLTAAWTKAKSDPNFVIENWKFGNGVFVTLPNSLILAIGDALIEQNQSCFNREAELTTQILAAATYTELMAIDLEAGWPN